MGPQRIMFNVKCRSTGKTVKANDQVAKVRVCVCVCVCVCECV